MTDSWTGSPGDDPRSRGVRKAIGVGSLVGILIAGAVLLFASGKVGPAKQVDGFVPLGSDFGTSSFQTGQAFLQDWQSGNLKAAANITDDPSAALAALTQYQSGLKLSGLTVFPGQVNSVGYMTFSVQAQAGAPAAPWSYGSGLAIYQGTTAQDNHWFVKWSPTVLFSTLAAGQKFALGTIPATATTVTDSGGTPLTPANAPSLANVISALEKTAPVSSGSTPGQEVQITDASGKVVANVTKISDPLNVNAVKTTISLPVQAAAEHAVKEHANSSMVVIQPSTGNILAIANNDGNGLDTALLGGVAPGSTFKIITSAMLINNGTLSSIDENVPCPPTLVADGQTLHNSEGESGDSTFENDFAQSCNNAFSSFYNKTTGPDLASAATQYFGFNTAWNIGLNQPTVYGHVPTSSGALLAEQLVGQGNVTANPLAMASVAATIATGSFKQPILVPGTTQVSATPLSGSTDSQMKTLMRSVITTGTLGGVFGGEAGVYGKTGTAEVQGQLPNSWTVAYKDDFSVCALAIAGNFGASAAGPETKSLLDAIDP
ncbi:MAG TPA: penicillin-binding transpeptidase domain-containing protein [Actinocrinis sp.]|nr:penicillin-binding transpeptidase domain-containing protein [Actinocrinis sp.]